MNYYPANAGWSSMWFHYNHNQVSRDFTNLNRLGANTVRLIVQPAAVGFPRPSARGKAALADAVRTARSRGLSVQLTLFDWWSAYTQTEASKQWIRSLLAPYRGNNQIALVEAQNEVNPSNGRQMAWARVVLAELGRVLPRVPRTVSMASAAAIPGLPRLVRAIPRSLLDVIDVHAYGDLNRCAADVDIAKSVARGRPVIVGEAGYSTFPRTTNGAFQAQVRFYQQMTRLVRSRGIPYFAPWIYSDFTKRGLPPKHRGNDPLAGTGLMRTNGSWKPAAFAVSRMFGGHLSAKHLRSAAVNSSTGGIFQTINYDGGFEFEDSAPRTADHSLGSWSVFDAGHVSRAGTTTKVHRSGRRSGYLSNARGSQVRSPSLYQQFPISGRGRITASTWVKLAGKTGLTRLSIAYFRGNRYLGNSLSAPAKTSARGWQRLAATGRTPVGADRMQVHIGTRGSRGTVYIDAVSIR